MDDTTKIRHLTTETLVLKNEEVADCIKFKQFIRLKHVVVQEYNYNYLFTGPVYLPPKIQFDSTSSWLPTQPNRS